MELALKYATEASNKERLQMLYWLKSGKVTTRQASAERLGRDEATITRWLKKYKDGGRAHHHPWCKTLFLEQLEEKPFSCFRVAAALRY